MKIELRPWTTPNFIYAVMPARPKQEGFQSESPSWHVRDVDADTLSEQCDKFRADVFKKAMKKDPKV